MVEPSADRGQQDFYFKTKVKPIIEGLTNECRQLNG